MVKELGPISYPDTILCVVHSRSHSITDSMAANFASYGDDTIGRGGNAREAEKQVYIYNRVAADPLGFGTTVGGDAKLSEINDSITVTIARNMLGVVVGTRIYMRDAGGTDTLIEPLNGEALASLLTIPAILIDQPTLHEITTHVNYPAMLAALPEKITANLTLNSVDLVKILSIDGILSGNLSLLDDPLVQADNQYVAAIIVSIGTHPKLNSVADAALSNAIMMCSTNLTREQLIQIYDHINALDICPMVKTVIENNISHNTQNLFLDPVTVIENNIVHNTQSLPWDLVINNVMQVIPFIHDFKQEAIPLYLRHGFTQEEINLHLEFARVKSTREALLFIAKALTMSYRKPYSQHSQTILNQLQQQHIPEEYKETVSTHIGKSNKWW